MKTLPLILSLGAALTLAAPPTRAESVVMAVDRPTALNFLRAATPYTIQVGAAGLTQRIILFNPRELRFEGGLIRLKVDCRGEPVDVRAVLEPTLEISFDRQQNAFVAKVRSLPLAIGGLGTVQLDSYLDPIVLPSSFSNTLEAGIPGLVIDTVVRELTVLEDRIEAKADLVFRKNPPTPRTAAGH